MTTKVNIIITLTGHSVVPVGMLFVFDVQVFQRGDEGLGLEAAGSSGGHRGVTYGALGPDDEDVAS